MKRILLTALIILNTKAAFALGIPAPAEVKRDPIVKTPSAPSAPTMSFKAYWDGKNADSAKWTVFAQDAVSRIGQDLIKGPSDVATFCPMYDRLGTQDRINFWVQLVAAMAKYESGFNPASRMVETSMGNDPVTRAPTSSEGLMQISYSDEKNLKSVLPAGVCDFDYPSDKKFVVTDLRRTILNPKNNLTCAIGILNRQVQRKGMIAVASGAYWAVLKTDRRSNKLSQIRAITKSLSFCN